MLGRRPARGAERKSAQGSKTRQRPGAGEVQRCGGKGVRPRQRAAPTTVSPPAVLHVDWLRAGREGRSASTHHVGCARNAEALLRLHGGTWARDKGISDGRRPWRC